MKKNLHIIFLDFDDIKNPLLGAGQAKATFEVAKRLVKSGHKVTVISSKFPGSKDRKDEGIKYKHIGITTGNIRLNNLIYICALPFTVRKLTGDIIVECFTAPVTTLMSPLFSKIPVVALSTSFEAERFSKLYHMPFHLIEKNGLRFYKYFIALTEHFDKKMKKTNPNVYSKVIPEGVGKEFFRIKKKKAQHILFLARLDMDQKGIDLLLRAYAKISDKAKFPLVIAGNGPDEEKVKDMIKKLKIEDKVKMVGPTYGAKKEKYLSEALFVAFPSRNETFSCFALEALASQLPLVAFDIPGIAWSGNEVAIKSKPFNTSAYSKLLLSSMNETKMVELGKKARKFASGFTWESVTADFETFFRDVLVKEQAIYEK